MKNKKFLVVGFIFVLSISTFFADAKEHPTINILDNKQTINMIGGDMERSAAFLLKSTNPKEIANWVYKDIDLKVCRVSYDKKQELVEGEKTLEFYDNAIKAMQYVKNARPSVKFWGTLKSDYDGYGAENNLPDWIYKEYVDKDYNPDNLDTNKYACFLADYLKYHQDHKVPISYLSVTKEWGQVVTAEKEKETIEKLKDLLLNNNNYKKIKVPLFIGPASWGVGGGQKFLETVKEKNWSNLYYGFSTHDYDKPKIDSWKSFVDTSHSMNRFAWNDESNLGAGGRFNGNEPPISSTIDAYLKKTTFYRAGLDGEVLFENWSRGLSVETRSIYFIENQPGKRLRGYYISKLFGNHIYNWTYFDSSLNQLNDVDTMVFRHKNRLILWVLNKSENKYNNIEVISNKINFDPNIKVHQRYWTETTKIEGKTKSFYPHKNHFKISVPQKSISAFLLKLQ